MQRKKHEVNKCSFLQAGKEHRNAQACVHDDMPHNDSTKNSTEHKVKYPWDLDMRSKNQTFESHNQFGPQKHLNRHHCKSWQQNYSRHTSNKPDVSLTSNMKSMYFRCQSGKSLWSFVAWTHSVHILNHSSCVILSSCNFIPDCKFFVSALFGLGFFMFFFSNEVYTVF